MWILRLLERKIMIYCYKQIAKNMSRHIKVNSTKGIYKLRDRIQCMGYIRSSYNQVYKTLDHRLIHGSVVSNFASVSDTKVLEKHGVATRLSLVILNLVRRS